MLHEHVGPSSRSLCLGLADPERKQLFLDNGVRPSRAEPASFNGRVLYWGNSTIKPELGGLPNVTVESVALLPEPSRDVMTAVVDMWYQVSFFSGGVSRASGSRWPSSQTICAIC